MSLSDDSTGFVEGSRVLCFHGPLIYEAKIQKVDKDKFFIHYHGWKRHWDEWVTEARLLCYNEQNLKRKQELIAAHEARVRAKKTEKSVVNVIVNTATASNSTSGSPQKRRNNGKTSDEVPEKKGEVEESASGSSTATLSSDQVGRTRSSSRKSARPTSTTAKKNAKKVQVSIGNQTQTTLDTEKAAEACVESAEQFYTKVEIRIQMPDALKPLLVDDWDYITRQRKLVVLPARITVDQLIQDYKTCRLSNNDSSGDSSAVLEVTTGLKEYFNVMLGSQLLYKFEREQYADILKDHPDLPVTKIYGPIHLLRLFVKLGGMLTYTPLDVKSVEILQHYLQDLLLYVTKNMNSLFQIQDYGTAPPEYHRRAL